MIQPLNEQEQEVKNKTTEKEVKEKAPDNTEAMAAVLKEFEAMKVRMAALEQENVALKEELKEPPAPVVPVVPAVKTITLVSEAKLRVFYVDPIHVKKVIRGTTTQLLPKTTNIGITPGSIVEFDEEFAKHLLTYKTFKIYGV